MPDSVAEMEYRILLEFEPLNHPVRAKLGMVLLRQDKLEEAAGEFSRILAAAPVDFDALDALSLVKTRQKKYAEAITLLHQAIKINDADIMVHYHLGEALENNGDLAGAEKAYQKAQENDKKAVAPAKNPANSQKIVEALARIRERLTRTSLNQNKARP